MVEQQLSPEQQEFVMANTGLVGRALTILRQHPLVNRLPREEAHAVAMFGLCRAALMYKPDRGFAFSTYAMRVILTEVQRAGLTAGVIKLPGNWSDEKLSEASRSRALAAWNMHGLPYFAHESVPDERSLEEESTGENYQSRASLERILPLLGKIRAGDRRALELTYLEGMTLEEAGRVMGLSKERVRQRRVRAVVKLRELLGVMA